MTSILSYFVRELVAGLNSQADAFEAERVNAANAQVEAHLVTSVAVLRIVASSVNAAWNRVPR